MDQRYDESEFWSTEERPTLSLPVIRRAHREGRAGLLGDHHYRVSPSHPTTAQFRRRRTGAVAGVLAIALIGVVSLSGGGSDNGAAINPLAPAAPVAASSTSSTEATTVSTDAAVDESASQQADVAAQVVAPRAAAKTAARKTVAPSAARKTTAKKAVARVVVPTKRTTTTTDAPTTRRTTTTAAAERRPSAARPTLASRPSCRNASYRVRPGDSWIAIARKARTNLNALLRVNGATARTPMHAGMKICLPAKARRATTTTTTTPGRSTTTTVKPKPTTSTTKPRSTTTTTQPKPTTTTTQPKPTTTTTVPRQNTYTRAEVQQIIRDVWPDDLEDKAIAIAWRESNWVPTVRNYCCFGLFQIYWNVHKSWLIPLGVKSSDMLFDPRINATAALALYQRAGGWAPWNL